MNRLRALSFVFNFAEDDSHNAEVNGFYFKLFDDILREIRGRKTANGIYENHDPVKIKQIEREK